MCGTKIVWQLAQLSLVPAVQGVMYNGVWTDVLPGRLAASHCRFELYELVIIKTLVRRRVGRGRACWWG